MCDQQALDMISSFNGTPGQFANWGATGPGRHDPALNACMKQWYHKPLDVGPFSGHGENRVENVFTMVRSPVSRTASGFVHALLGCKRENASSVPGFVGYFDQAQGPSIVKTACSALAGSDPVSIAIAEEEVLKYSLCVKGCQANMIEGGRICNGRQSQLSIKHTRAMSERATAKLGRFAFVGITGRWSESICIFQNMFPRASGKPYPQSLVNLNMRAQKDKTCEDRVADVLHANPAVAHDYLDEAIFAAAEERLEKALLQYPQCKHERRMHEMGSAIWV